MKTFAAFTKELAVLMETTTALSPSSRLVDVGNWDSMVVIAFMAMADEQFGTSVSPTALMECHTVGDLAGLCGIPT